MGIILPPDFTFFMNTKVEKFPYIIYYRLYWRPLAAGAQLLLIICDELSDRQTKLFDSVTFFYPLLVCACQFLIVKCLNLYNLLSLPEIL